MLEVARGVRLNRRGKSGNAQPEDRPELPQVRQCDRAPFEKSRAKCRTSRQLHPMGNHFKDGCQCVVVNVGEVATMVSAPLFERAAVKQIQELVEVAEEERLGLRVSHPQRPHIFQDECEGRQRGDEVVHTTEVALGEDGRLLPRTVASCLGVKGARS